MTIGTTETSLNAVLRRSATDRSRTAHLAGQATIPGLRAVLGCAAAVQRCNTIGAIEATQPLLLTERRICATRCRWNAPSGAVGAESVILARGGGVTMRRGRAFCAGTVRCYAEALPGRTRVVHPKLPQGLSRQCCRPLDVHRLTSPSHSLSWSKALQPSGVGMQPVTSH